VATVSPEQPRSWSPGSGRWSTISRVGLLLLIAVAGSVVCALIAWVGINHLRTGLVVAMCIVMPIPWVIRRVQGRFDVFEPIHLVAVCVGIVFIWRPIWELQTHATPYPGYDQAAGFDAAMGIGLVGTLCTYVAYFSPVGGRLAGRFRPLPDTWDAQQSVRFVRRLLYVAAFLTALYIGQAGLHYVLGTYTGRTAGTQQLSNASSGYFYQGPYLTIPASFILLVAYRRRRTTELLIMLVALVVLTLAITVPAGDRTFVLELVLPLVAMWYLQRGRRPRVTSIAVFFVVFLMFVNIELAFRTTQLRAGRSLSGAITQTVEHPQTALSKFISGPDPSEFTALEIEAHAYSDGQLSHMPGTTLTSLFTGWIPHQFFAHNKKPFTPLQYVTWTLFPSTYGGGSFEPSMYGSMFVDDGWFTVIILSLIVGVGLRAVWEYYLRAPRSAGMQLLLAAALPMTVIMLRSDIDDIVYRSLFLLVPLVLCVVTCSRPSRRVRASLARQARFRLAAPRPGSQP
jgi:hypothetical protein